MFGTLPTASALISGISAYSAPLITEYLPIIYIGVGIGIVGTIVAWALGWFRR